MKTLLTTPLVALALGCSAADAPSVTTSESAISGGLAWVGDTHLRYDGKWIPTFVVMSGRALDVYTQTWPGGTARRVDLFWKEAGTVRSAPMTVDREGAGASGNNTQWRATIPAAHLVADAAIETWIRAEGPDGRVLWDSNAGRNFRIVPRSEVVLWNGGPPDLWRMAGRGSFAVENGALVARPASGLGLLWCTVPTPESYQLDLEFRLDDANDNSGVFLRFRDPETFGYENTAWAAVHDGLEIQIDETARPDGADIHRTGAFYEIAGQVLTLAAARDPGQWNHYRIRVSGDEFSVDLNGQRITSLSYAGDPARPLRARSSGARFVGVQSHTGAVSFRNIRLTNLP